MSNAQIRILDCATGEEIVRDMTEDELAQLETDKSNSLKRKAEEAEKIAARQALLDKLGITEDEAKLLLGGN